MMKGLKRYIEIYSNVTDELLVRIEVKMSANDIRQCIVCDSDDLDVLGVYSLTNEALECFGVTNYDEGNLSFFITSEA